MNKYVHMRFTNFKCPMLYLLESPLGLAIFKRSQDDMTLLKRLTFDHGTDTTAVFNALNQGEFPPSLKEFIAENCPIGCTINVLNPRLCAQMMDMMHLNAVCVPDEHFRRIRTNHFKYFDVPKDISRAMTARLAHKLVETSRDDMVVIDLLSCVEEMDVSINCRTMRVREWYSIHFPELDSVADNTEYLRTVLRVGNKSKLIAAHGPDQDDKNSIAALARHSMGCDMKDTDIDRITEDIQDILRDVEHRDAIQVLMRTRIQQGFPNMYNLAGEQVTAKLLSRAGSISRLAQMPSSTIQILGAEKAFNEAVKAKSNTPKHGLIFHHSFVSGVPEDVRGRMARVFANKISLCARVDSDPARTAEGEFGTEMRRAVERLVERQMDRGKKMKKAVLKTKKRVISVNEYDVSRDSRKRAKDAKELRGDSKQSVGATKESIGDGKQSVGDAKESVSDIRQ